MAEKQLHIHAPQTAGLQICYFVCRSADLP